MDMPPPQSSGSRQSARGKTSLTAIASHSTRTAKAGTQSAGSTPGSRPTTPRAQTVIVSSGTPTTRPSPILNTGRFTSTLATSTNAQAADPPPVVITVPSNLQADSAATDTTTDQLNEREASSFSQDNPSVAISTTGVPIMVRRQTDDDQVSTVSSCVAIHRGNCCVHTRRCLESSAFSFTLGVLLFITGICLIGATTNIDQNSYFLIGPFSLAAGTILLIRGCINELAKRQQAKEANAAARLENGHHRSNLTREERVERNEQAALAEDNTIIPPAYEEVIPSIIKHPPSTLRTISVGSQANFDELVRLSPNNNSTATHGIQHRGTGVGFNRLISIQSQTSFPSLVDIGVDTSDLPTEPDAISQAPPNYYQAISPPSAADLSTTESEVAIYLGDEETA